SVVRSNSAVGWISNPSFSAQGGFPLVSTDGLEIHPTWKTTDYGLRTGGSMSRTMLSVFTAAALAGASVGGTIGRYQVLGDEVRAPTGPGTWKVTLLVQGQSIGTAAKVLTTTPLDFGHQHILDELCRSDELLAKPPDSRHPERRQVLWTQRPGVPE